LINHMSVSSNKLRYSNRVLEKVNSVSQSMIDSIFNIKPPFDLSTGFLNESF